MLECGCCYFSIPEDIPSDAEAEARVHQSECADGLPGDDGTSESLRMSSVGMCLSTSSPKVGVLRRFLSIFFRSLPLKSAIFLFNSKCASCV